jgi:pyruvate formate lyase activating enzyme
MISRREFLSIAARLASIAGGAGLVLSDPLGKAFLSGGGSGSVFARDPIDEIIASAPLARYWTSVASAKGDCSACHNDPGSLKGKPYRHKADLVKCLLCAHGCVIENGQRGRCRTRLNIKGELRSLVYGRPLAVHIDPIEKKPFYHFLPGAAAYSLATAGCPFQCKFCQNWEISRASPEDYKVPYTLPAKVTRAASDSRARVIAFTYNEPTVFTEYLTDIAREAKKQGLRSVLVSCGFMNEAPLAEMCEVLDAVKIDLKGYSEHFYQYVCGAELKPVLRSIKQAARSRTHLEIVNLVVPTLNDSDRMILELISWILGEVGPDVPVHFTRFHPDYQLLNLPPTPVATLERAREAALGRGLHYPYVGNVPGHAGNHTYCPNCKKIVVQREGFFIVEINIKDGHCKFCNHKIAGVWI